MRILISGAGGLVGRRLAKELQRRGHTVVALSRMASGGGWKAGHGLGCVVWSPESEEAHLPDFEGFDGVVHLAGEPIIGRWNLRKKKAIRDSRVQGTRFLAELLARVEKKPSVLLTVSAVGIYGDTGDSVVDETEEGPAAGTDFLADVAREWEAAAQPARDAGIRVVNPRLGVVLDRRGGALKAMLLPFQLGLGGPVGDGRPWMSWISNRDVARAMAFLLENPACEGPYNLVALEAVTNRDFSKALGRALNRPAILPVPAFAVKLLYGKECAEATVLRSTRVTPKRLIDGGFTFEDLTVDQGLKSALAD